MQYPLVRAALIGLALVCDGADARENLARFDFPGARGSLQLWTEPCADAAIVRLYDDDMPEPFLTGALDLHGRVLSGCWYQADGRVFFTDNEGNLLVPPPRVDQFWSPDGLQRFDQEAILHTYIR